MQTRSTYCRRRQTGRQMHRLHCAFCMKVLSSFVPLCCSLISNWYAACVLMRTHTDSHTRLIIFTCLLLRPHYGPPVCPHMRQKGKGKQGGKRRGFQAPTNKKFLQTFVHSTSLKSTQEGPKNCNHPLALLNHRLPFRRGQSVCATLL